MSFKDYLLTETFKNLFNSSEKEKWVDQVWDILQASYEKIGGIKGKGFSSKEEMIKNIPFWKIAVKGGKVVAVVMYRDKNGRKSVALGTDGTRAGKDQLIDIFKNDLHQGRSFGEKSGPALRFLQRNVPDWEKYRIKADDVPEILGKTVKKTGKYTYTRTIGGEEHEKMTLGTPGKKIVKR